MPDASVNDERCGLPLILLFNINFIAVFHHFRVTPTVSSVLQKLAANVTDSVTLILVRRDHVLFDALRAARHYSFNCSKLLRYCKMLHRSQ